MTALTASPLEHASLLEENRRLHREAADLRAEITRLSEALLDAHRRHEELTRRLSAALRERDVLAQRVREVVAVTRTEPEITLYCDSCDCPPITRAVAPPEDAIPQWVRGLGWECAEDGYRCPGCKCPPAGQFHVERKDVRR